MSQRRVRRTFQLACALVWALAAFALPALAAASQYHGQVTFHGWPVPGATVTVTQGTKKVSIVSDQGGLFTFTELPDGPAKLQIEMQGFSTLDSEVTITANTPAAKFELTLLPLNQMMARTKLAPNP
ncbi:MAG: carboxypeptidase-like regulatory domain-containing protein, partial [Candidatus Sulfotelmatobacter sp.]